MVFVQTYGNMVASPHLDMKDANLDARIEALLPKFEPGTALLRTWRLDGGISSQMVGFELRRPDGQIVKRIARQANRYTVEGDPYPAQREFKTLQAVRSAKIPAPEPIYLEPLGAGSDPPLYILEFIEGAPNLSPKNPAQYLATYAALLAKIHCVDLGQHDFSFLRRRTSLEPAERTGPPNEELRETVILEAMQTAMPLPAANPVFRHGDFWPGNLIWQDERCVGIIDWEEAVIGEALADLAICRLDLTWILGYRAAEEFTAEYQRLTGQSLDDLPYWDLWASLRPIRNIGEWATSYPPLGRPDITEATMVAAHQAFVEQAFSRI